MNLVEPFARMLSVLNVLKVSEFFSIVPFFQMEVMVCERVSGRVCYLLSNVQFSRKGSSPFMWHSFRENAHLVLAFKIFFLKCKGKKKKVECFLRKAS